MIEIKTTWDTVVMLLVSGGVGFLGGIGAGLLEMRRDPSKEKEWAKLIGSSIVLGGIAAVAILYFFPPEETKTVVANGTTEIFTGYSLTKLVALALIVGSAGGSFLLIMQKKTTDLVDAQKVAALKTAVAAQTAGEAKAVQAQATEAVRSVGNQAKTLAKSGVVESVEPTIRKALEEAASGGAISAETVSAVAQELGDQAGIAVDKSIGPVVENAQDRILESGVTDVVLDDPPKQAEA